MFVQTDVDKSLRFLLSHYVPYHCLLKSSYEYTKIKYYIVSSSWFRASSLNVNKNPTYATVCRYLFTAKLLYMFRVSQHPSPGVPIRPRWRGVAVQVVWPVPEAAGTVFNIPDDGCCDTQNMYSSFAVNKYLHTVVSVGFLFTLYCLSYTWASSKVSTFKKK